ncbi:type VII secretion protein EssC [Pseudobutyrivibrio ruminis]|uniref:type VII secretion protein EssC n=1 Tax=Pseudobutyrivibrio ruminis TaxID=46206 RepID=UPI0004135253|nr:type VII secretion protein EssC [Pseudobutyrivibrio ruminis]
MGELNYKENIFYNIRTSYDLKIDISNINEVLIGNNPRHNILVNIQDCAFAEVKVTKRGNQFEVSKAAEFDCYINGALFVGSEIVNNEFFLTFGKYNFYITDKAIFTTVSKDITTNLPHIDLTHDGKALDYPEFFLKARYLYNIPDEKIEILNPENPPQEPKKNLLMTLTPMILTLCLMIFVRGRMMSGGIMYVLYFAATMVIGGAMSVWAYFENGKDYKKKVAERERVYSEYIDKKIKDIQKLRDEEKQILSRRNPTVEETVKRIVEFSPDLFEKHKDHEDYLDVRIGTGSVESLLQVDYKEQEYVHVFDELINIPKKLHDQFEYIPDMPVTLPLAKVNAVGFVGNRTKLYHLMKNLTLTIAGQEAFTDVKMVFLLDDVYAPYMEWVRWLPGTYDENSGMRNIMYDEESSKNVLGALYAEISRREYLKEDEIKLLPDYIVFAFRSERLSEHPVSKYFEYARKLGFTFLFFEEQEALLHKACQLGVFLDDNANQGYVQDLEDSTEIQNFTYTHITKEIAAECAKKLAPIYIKEPSLENDLVKSITLYQLLGIKNVKELALGDRWNKSRIYESMAAPMGLKSGGDVVYLDIHEKFHGPHGLVAGTTGSGKSEILQTYILSLATLFHPYEVGFIIIDFKGGGMANQFKDLPHLNGAITNIDGKQINRSLMSIKAELIKRQELFAKYDVNKIDDYIKLFKNGTTPTPLPHLIVIVDEFAELKSEQPEFMKELISAARIGRSLGVHLILATQKPAGVVNDQIWSNSKFKLCLKVQDKSDSNEVLKSPLAAEIREPGRAYMQVGNNEIFELFQSAYSGAYITDEHAKAVKKFSISTIDLAGRRHVVYSQKPEKNDNTVTELDAIVQHINKYCADSGIEKLQEICLPPLPEVLPYPEKLEKEGTDIVVPVGIYDDPSRQAQNQLMVNFTQNHVFILGSSLSGKTYLIQNMIYGLTQKYAPEDVNIYILDFASMVMKAFEKLNHVGSVISLSDDDKLKHFIQLMQKKIEERREILSSAGLSSFGAYREAGNTDLPQIVVFLENYTAFKDVYAEYEDSFIKICRDGVALGISVVITNQQMSGIGYKLITNFSTKIAMNCNDRSQYNMLIDKCRTTPDEYAGRGLITIDNEIMEFQTYMAFGVGKEVERISNIREYITQCNTKYAGKSAENVDYVPNVLNDEYMKNRFGTAAMKDYKMLVGLGYATTNPEYNDMKKNPIMGIIGRDELGRSDYVKYMFRKFEECIGGNPVQIHVVDDASGSLSYCKDDVTVKEYTDNQMEIIDVIEVLYNKARERFAKKSIGGDISSEPLVVAVFADKKAPDVIYENQEAYDMYRHITKEYLNCKVTIIFTNVENKPLGVSPNPVMFSIKNSLNTLFFEDMKDIRLIEINPGIVRQVKKPNAKGDAFYIADGKIKRVKTIE